jgi:hypothetical protein
MNKTNFCQKPFSDFDIASFSGKTQNDSLKMNGVYNNQKRCAASAPFLLT